VLILVGLYFVFFKSPQPDLENVNENNVACTMDAKVCPDGSYVGRIPPDCAFAPCPKEVFGPTSWLTFEDKEQNISFSYPKSFTTNYMSVVAWPPKVTVSDKAYNCPVTDATSSLPNRISERRVDDRTYCVTAISEGAAGSVFTEYTYSASRDGKLINIGFTLRYPQCYNYDEPEKSACEGERETFDLDSVIDKIAQSVTNL